jgi:hypothetical protein
MRFFVGLHDARLSASTDRLPLIRSRLPDTVRRVFWGNQGGHSIELFSGDRDRRAPSERVFLGRTELEADRR